MPHYIVKAHPDNDFYVDWSTIVDAPIEWGPAADFTEQIPADRKERADRNGTSSHDPRFFGWQDPFFIVANLGDGRFYNLPRPNLQAFCEAMNPDPDNPAVQQAALNQYATPQEDQ